ncbi:hypothetical protein BLA29_001092 [Euroglyphus maynei]|uniref:Uncharacterized protein n=1 Tax=Euroglyphus maynei TaxID=6958 RepID=A0A1Y3BUU9_EURMA|nr:hypothetical protein BLA29_001092 [Euroglyphus maynei]
MSTKNAAQPFIYQQQNVGLNQPPKHPTARDFVLLATTNPSNNGISEPVTILNAPPLTIPIGQTAFIPTAQYQFLSSNSNGNSMNSTISSPAAIQFPNNFLISGPGGQTLNESNTMTILTSPPRTIQLAQLADTSSLNFNSTFLPTNTAKFLSIGQNNASHMFHQLLLYPPATTIINSDNEPRKQLTQSHRSNSLPADSLHPLQRYAILYEHFFTFDHQSNAYRFKLRH